MARGADESTGVRRDRHGSVLPNGPALVGLATLALVIMTALLLAYYGTAEAGIRVVIRATARTSFVLFMLAFVASALRRAWRAPASAWLLANRRYLGLSFAVSHGIHLAAILALYDWSARRFVVQTGAAATSLGGLGYLFVLAMAATSFDGAVRRLGRRRWQRLHTVGAYYLWLIFTISYVPRALVESPAYLPPAMIAIGGLALRVLYRRGRTREMTRAAA